MGPRGRRATHERLEHAIIKLLEEEVRAAPVVLPSRPATGGPPAALGVPDRQEVQGRLGPLAQRDL